MLKWRVNLNRLLIIVLAVTFYLIGFTNIVYAQGEAPLSQKHGVVTIVVLDRVTINDLVEAQLPNISKIMDNGAIGLMTTNSAHGVSRIPQNTYATIGAGAKIEAGYAGGLAFNGNEFEPESAILAAKEFENRTGIRPSEGNVVHLGIAEIWNINEELKYSYVPGGLGTALHAEGLKTAVLGNSDTRGYQYRYAVTIAMDKDGLVDYGDVSLNLLKSDDTAIYGRKIDYEKMIKKYKDFKTKADLIVLELGDIARIEYASGHLLPEIAEEKRLKVLTEVDSFMGRLSSELNLNEDLLMILSPTPTSAAVEEHNYLTPIILSGKGINQGMLESASTKRLGLINNTDILPTILEYYDLPLQIPYSKEGLKETVIPSGQPIKVMKEVDPVHNLAILNNEIVKTYNSRYPLVKGFINLELIMILVAALGILMNLKYAKYIKPFLIVIITMPLAMMLQYFIPSSTVINVVLVVLGLIVILTGLAYLTKHLFKSRDAMFSAIGLLTAAVIIIDLLTGGLLNKTSPFSYDPMLGARFYGIGNEYMGVLIGSLLMGLGTLPGSMTKLKKIIYLAVLAITIYVLVAPNLGTNVGGTIAALIGFGLVGLLIFNKKPNIKLLSATALGLGVLFIGFLVFDMSRSVEAQSHIGRTMNLLVHGGAEEALNIISRKWAVNWRLIRGSTWSWAYFSGLISVFLFWHSNKLQCIKKKKPVFYNFLIGIIAASLGALLFNDSGVVAAAVMILFGAAPLYYFLFDEGSINKAGEVK